MSSLDQIASAIEERIAAVHIEIDQLSAARAALTGPSHISATPRPRRAPRSSDRQLAADSFAIVQLLGAAPEGLSSAEVSRRLGLTASRATRLLRELADGDLVSLTGSRRGSKWSLSSTPR